MNSLRLIATLVLSQMRLKPGRAVLTILGMVASTAAVLWVVSGYDALASQFDEHAGKYLGRYDALVLPTAGPGSFQILDRSLVASLQRDPGILELNPITQSRVSVTKAEGDARGSQGPLEMLVGNRPPVFGAPPLAPVLVGTPAIEPPYELVQGDWLSNSVSNEAVELPSAVLSAGAALDLKVQIGDKILITTLANQVRLRVVGIIEQAPDEPTLQAEAAPRTENIEPAERPTQARIGLPTAWSAGPAISAIYVRPSIAETINGFPSHPNVLQISFRDGFTAADLQTVWKERFQSSPTPVRMVTFAEIRQGMESSESLSSQWAQAWAATGMALLAAIFIIFSTLSIGVSERAREFALLRAIGLSRLQLAGVIYFESAVLALLGWLGGLAAGAAMLWIGSNLAPGRYSAGAVFGSASLLLTGLTVLAGALGAAVLPTWRAIRIQPLEALAMQTAAPRFQGWLWPSIAGVLLAATAPLIVFILPMSDELRLWGYALVAWPALAIGMLLLAPTSVLLTERLFAPLLSRALGLDARLVETQLSSQLWRTLGATLALSLGLALYTSTQTWGHSMLQPFLPGDWLPDALVAFQPIGLDDAGLADVEHAAGIRANGVLPLTIEQARFAWGTTAVPAGLRYDNAVLFGFDPERALGDNPFLNLHFVEGSGPTAVTALQAGNACVISQDFQMSSGLQVGDSLSFTPPNAPGTTVSYRIAGVVALPGWQWITKFSGVRRHFVRTATMVFVSRDDVRRDFQLERTEFVWLKLNHNVSLPALEAALQKIAERDAGGTFHAEGVGEVKAHRPFARVTATETVRQAITIAAVETIQEMSQAPLVTLVIMALAVANAVLASVRARTWEFGVMRAVGFTRWQLVRLIVAETLLMGLVACVLSLVFGLIAGWCGVEMARYGRWFAGPPHFLIPWASLLFGFTFTLLLCLLAALAPAVRTGRAEPLALLRAGRGSS